MAGGRILLILSVGLTGCASAPPVDNPVQVRRTVQEIENPVLVSPGAPTGTSYREVFEKCVGILLDYKYEILSANPFDGRIVTKPRIAPGYEQFWRAGNPDPRSRLLATVQTIRQTAVIEIRTGERGGYLVYVIVEKEQEDIAKPTRQRIGAVFQEAPTVGREIEVVGSTVPNAPSSSWFRIGRDFAFEQVLLTRIRECR